MKLAGKIFLAALDVAALIMLVLCALFYWTVPGFILLALAAVQYIAQTAAFVARRGAAGLASPAVAVLLVGAAFAVITAGIGMSAVEALFVSGAILALLSASVTFAE